LIKLDAQRDRAAAHAIRSGERISDTSHTGDGSHP
jgi:hypothetical protein